MQLKLAAVVSAATTVIKLKEGISRETEFFDKYTDIQKGCSILICYILFLFDY